MYKHHNFVASHRRGLGNSQTDLSKENQKEEKNASPITQFVLPKQTFHLRNSFTFYSPIEILSSPASKPKRVIAWHSLKPSRIDNDQIGITVVS